MQKKQKVTMSVHIFFVEKAVAVYFVHTKTVFLQVKKKQT